MQAKKDSPILNKTEKAIFENWLRNGIADEINILDELTREDYDQAFRLNVTKQKSSSIAKYLQK